MKEERFTNLSYVVKDGNQISRMSWAKADRGERYSSTVAGSYSSWVLGMLRAWVPC